MSFTALSERIVDNVLCRDPVLASSLGDHRGDDRLEDATADGLDEQRRELRAGLAALAALPADGGGAGGAGDVVDRQVLAGRLEARLLDLEDLRGRDWDPLRWNPGSAVYLLLARDYAPLADRLRSLAGRLAAVPEHLAVARATLGSMPRVHVETAVGQFTGTRTLLTGEVDVALEREPSLRSEVEPVRAAAIGALDAHLTWLRGFLDEGGGDGAKGRDPRIGPELFARKLALALDAQSDPDALLARAEEDLVAAEERMAQVARRLGGSPREVLDRLAAEGSVTDETVLPECERALESTTAFLAEHDLVTLLPDPVEIIVMPEIHRGISVAYCDPPGPLETAPLPTYFAVSPTPQDWTPERVASFYREYNVHMLHNLTVHEAMPGHVLQLAHARRHRGSVVRAAFRSGSFVEGWAVVAEELMAEAGYAGSGSVDAVRMQQLKMQLRMIINTIIDIRVHTRGMTQAEAMALMTGRGHQEDGEAAGKWRRALLTSTQLSTYYVGYREVGDVIADLRAARPGASAREIHDAVLAHGSPAPRHLRTLLGLSPFDDRSSLPGPVGRAPVGSAPTPRTA